MKWNYGTFNIPEYNNKKGRNYDDFDDFDDFNDGMKKKTTTTKNMLHNTINIF